jgi:hypothetical protein
MSSPHAAPKTGAVADPPRYYGLLYVDREHHRHVNLRSSLDPVAVYAGCASLMAASARAAGESFTVLTNTAEQVGRAVESAGFPPFPCEEMLFDLALPPGIRFFQAHHKLCVLEAMGSGVLGAFVGVIDIDAVMQAPLSGQLGQAPGICAYALDEALAGARVSDLDLLIGQGTAPRRWYGGEFIAGDQTSIGVLAAVCRRLLPRYLDLVPQLRHVGDETLVSAALNLLQQEGMAIRDVGAEGVVTRWYSSRLPVRQAPLAEVLDAVVLHLPSDKLFLRNQARKPFETARFRRDLMRRVASKSMLRSLANPFLNLAERERMFPPRVGRPRATGPPWRPPIPQEGP